MSAAESNLCTCSFGTSWSTIIKIYTYNGRGVFSPPFGLERNSTNFIVAIKSYYLCLLRSFQLKDIQKRFRTRRENVACILIYDCMLSSFHSEVQSIIRLLGSTVPTVLTHVLYRGAVTENLLLKFLRHFEKKLFSCQYFPVSISVIIHSSNAIELRAFRSSLQFIHCGGKKTGLNNKKNAKGMR